MLHTGGKPSQLTEAQHSALDRILEENTDSTPPEIVLTFDGRPHECRRRKHLHDKGAVVLFAVCNWGYVHAPADFFTPKWGIDAALFVSDFQRRQYAERVPLPRWHGVRPTPLCVDSVVATTSIEPRAVVFVNPTPEKGVMVFIRLADELAKRRPDIPLLVVESRGNKDQLWSAAHAACVDLGRHPRLRVIPHVPMPRDIFARTKILLMPSVWPEPSGRLIGEALLNGVPPIVSDRGGMPAECRGAGVVIPLADHIQPKSTFPPTIADIEPWLEAILELWDSPEAYAKASAAARAAAQAFAPGVLQAQYDDLVTQARASKQNR